MAVLICFVMCGNVCVLQCVGVLVICVFVYAVFCIGFTVFVLLFRLCIFILCCVCTGEGLLHRVTTQLQ